MNRIFLHIGVAKAATTTLQHEVFAKHSQIAYLGKPFRRSDDTAASEDGRLRADVIRPVWTRDSLEYDAAVVKRRFDEAFDPSACDGRVALLSEEALSGGSVVDRRLVAERLRELFGPCNILITIRSQATCVPSLYSHYLRKGLVRDTPFETWLENVLNPTNFDHVLQGWMLRRFRYFELYRLYREVFSDGAVKVLLYEQLAEEPAAFSRELQAFCGIDADETLRLIAEARRLNPARAPAVSRIDKCYREAKRAYGRARSRFFPTFSLRRYLPAAVSALERTRAVVTDQLDRAANAGQNHAISEEARALLLMYYGEDNGKLVEACGLPLDDYGYPQQVRSASP